jgi:CRISPR-associated protein Cas6
MVSRNDPALLLGPVLDLAFPVVAGRALPVEHGQALYDALRGACPDLPAIAGLGIHAVEGAPGAEPGMLELAAQAEVKLRVPLAAVPVLGTLAGRELDLQGRRLSLGVPRQTLLAPFPALWAHRVLLPVKELGRMELQAFVERHFRAGFPGAAVAAVDLPGRPGHKSICFAVAVRNLDPRSSLRLQSEGFGGGRALGFGLFVPNPRRAERLNLALVGRSD